MGRPELQSNASSVTSSTQPFKPDIEDIGPPFSSSTGSSSDNSPPDEYRISQQISFKADPVTRGASLDISELDCFFEGFWTQSSELDLKMEC